VARVCRHSPLDQLSHTRQNQKLQEQRIMTEFFTTMDSPIGEIVLRGDGRSLTGVFTHGPKLKNPRKGAENRDDDPVLTRAREELIAYYAGKLAEFKVPLAPHGTPFQQRVWQALLEIPFGETQSYGQLARRIGSPNAARAVGLANGRNPIAIIIPCHRVIGSSGSLVGYGGGLPRKKWLLEHEARFRAEA
jgi:methylated-DNA-[protein]-cysteine S-methyltransferase